MTGEPLKPTSARERRANNTFVVAVSPNLTVRLRKTDPLEMVFSGMLKMDAVGAALHFQDVQDRFSQSKNPEDREKAVQDLLNGSDKKALLDFAKEFAIANVLEPAIVATKEEALKNPDCLWVGELDFSELMGIFNAQEGEGDSLLTRQRIEEFRRTEPSPTGDAGPAGEEVRPEAKLMDSPGRTYIGA
jgi:hypothetical protein